MLLRDLFVAGGIVMYPLLRFSIVAIALIIERYIFRAKVNCQQGCLVRDLLAAYQMESNVVLLKLRRNGNLPIAQIFLEAIRNGLAPPQAFDNFWKARFRQSFPCGVALIWFSTWVHRCDRSRLVWNIGAIASALTSLVIAFSNIYDASLLYSRDNWRVAVNQ